jgi:hypothetical protein
MQEIKKMNSKPDGYWWAHAKYWIAVRIIWMPICIPAILATTAFPILLFRSKSIGSNVFDIFLISYSIILAILAPVGILGFLCQTGADQDKVDDIREILRRVNYKLDKETDGLHLKTNNYKKILYGLVEKNKIDIETALRIKKKVNKEIFYHDSQFIHIEDIIRRTQEEKKMEKLWKEIKRGTETKW